MILCEYNLLNCLLSNLEKESDRKNVGNEKIKQAGRHKQTSKQTIKGYSKAIKKKERNDQRTNKQKRTKKSNHHKHTQAKKGTKQNVH